MPSEFSLKAIKIMKNIPGGKVVTYGQVATYAGNNRGARQIVRLLNSSWEKEQLPWHRVINSKGKISLTPGDGYELQKMLLENEGIQFDENDLIDLSRFGWNINI
jgi:methylated-DNA-protein-cysteine methyltransferase-like protein